MIGIPRRLSALVLAGVGIAGLLAPAAVAADPRHSGAATTSAQWLAGEFVDGALPGPVGDMPDWGITIDGLIALEATGTDPEAAERVATTVADNVRSYNSHDDWGGDPEVRIGGATAKLLYAAVISESDPTDFGGHDMRAETLELVRGPETGAEEGRISDRETGTDNSNTFGQSLGVLGLVRSGGVPQEVVDFLLRQQCSEGGFRLSPDQFGTPAPTCDEAESPVLDPDSTGMAVQALLAAGEEGIEGATEAAELGADWLEEIQREDGSFGGSGPTVGSNTNSTGLAAQALAATGRQEAADVAAEWILDHQVTSSSGAASDEAGAIAYNTDARDTAISDGIPDMQKDQWRRATAQALLGLAQVPLGTIGITEGTPTDPPTDTPPPTTGPPTDPSSPGDPTSPPATDPTDPTDPAGDDPTDTPPPGGVDTGSGPHDAQAPPAEGQKPNLPITGGALLGLIVVAVVLVTAGGALHLSTRRRADHV